ncbi:hypothetical protein CS078_10320 [Pseudomonas prosekii]|uniref:Shedu protein SduA C-terminal domain-containing protein n=1 Tax=Pseudomonas prosekii TaxID=1148509 RepID=A0A3L8CRC2_9PSED|nr:Shedu immune nuclease family protein [Pseudomonas prosekii]RLU07404.1 hypothetical protein CS076_18305 [Pseudomonas prosekii]RLU10503.1 hypothetical protein CS078_10320 [Pseudomonas prosekii]
MDELEKPIQVKVKSRWLRSPHVRAYVMERHGSECSFPGCGIQLYHGDQIFFGQIASIVSAVEHGPRYSISLAGESDTPDNYILLCPNHHAIIDRKPDVYTAEWLREARVEHLNKMRRALSIAGQPSVVMDERETISLTEAVKFWADNKANAVEEFWQVLFQKCPAVLGQLFPRSMFQLGSKCYIGGKSLNNRAGNLVDFVYSSPLTSNAVLMEIKTPVTKLLGRLYRGNAYSISDELSGSCVQVLNYKEQFLKEYHNLSANSTDQAFSAFNPKCVIVIGNISTEIVNPTQMKSFELFRTSVTGVEIVTYDELFEKVQSMLEMLAAES